MSSITLAFICKNEAHCIARMLESVKPFISYYVVGDTGSTDSTVQTIIDTMGDMPGEIHTDVWSDFSTNRNLVINRAKQHGDYTLMLDCDDWIEVTDQEWHEKLSAPIYNVMFHQSNIRYVRPQLWSNVIDVKYRGVLHEYLHVSDEIPMPYKTLQDCHIIYAGGGNRSKNPNKFIDDARVFEEALGERRDPDLHTRYTFYLAQSLRDAGLHQQAIFQYKKRSEMGDWIQEQYVSSLEMAKLYQKQNPSDLETLENILFKAYALIPERAEAMYYLSQFYRLQNQFHKAHICAKSILDLPLCEGLFIEANVYQYSLKDECSISAIYAGHKSVARKLIEDILKDDQLPFYDRTRITNNLRYC